MPLKCSLVNSAFTAAHWGPGNTQPMLEMRTASLLQLQLPPGGTHVIFQEPWGVGLFP